MMRFAWATLVVALKCENDMAFNSHISLKNAEKAHYSQLKEYIFYILYVN